MDYCSSCRRHLNGALVCPGCGAYAPDIAPATTPGHTTTAPAATALWPQPVGTPGVDTYDGTDALGGSEGFGGSEGTDDFDAFGGSEDIDTYDGTDESDDFDDFQGIDGGAPAAAASQGVGRAARRRQRVRWKKSQRRAVVATAVALVGGGLTLASMDRGSGHGNQASAASDLSSMGAGESSVDTSADLPVTTTGTGKHRGPAADEASTTGAHGNARRQAGTATTPHTDSATTRHYTASNSNSAPTAEQQVTGTVENTTSTATDTATNTTQSPPSTSTTDTGSGSSGSSGSSSDTSSGSSDTSQSGSGSTGSTSTSTSPSGLCVLNLLCVS
jgi:hypothetical protein